MGNNKTKVVSIIGTRPEIIRNSRILPKLDALCDHTVVHTNQNFSNNLKDIFFEELGLRKPDITLYTSMNDGNTHTEYGLGQQLADMFPQIEKVFKDIKPDKVFILGDTNSALCAIIAERMGIATVHMEAANRSYNREIPEEVNRRLLDHTCSYNLFYTPTNRHTLLMEGLDPKKIFQCGNPTREVLNFYSKQIDKSTILEEIGLAPWDGGAKAVYALVDIHRSENVNNQERLLSIFQAVNMIAEELKIKVICSIHPKTKDKLSKTNHTTHSNVQFLDSFGFFDFVQLERNARVGLTDSGLCSEEYCLLGVPCVIVRNETERPEVVEAGGAMISGTTVEGIVNATKIMSERRGLWDIPSGYESLNVSDKVVNYILGKAQ